MDVLSKMIAMIMVVVLIFLFPLQYLLGHQLDLTEDYVEDEVIHLVNEIRDKRYLDTQMYEEFLERLSVTGSLYDIEIERAVPKEGTEITSKEGIEGVLVASNELRSLPVIKEADYNENASTGEIFSLGAHTHTDACYVGHNHTASGCQSGFVCHEAPLRYSAFSYTSNGYYVQEYGWLCSVCYKVVALLKHRNDGGPVHTFTLLVRRTLVNNPYASDLVELNYSFSMPDAYGHIQGPPWGDVRIKYVFDDLSSGVGAGLTTYSGIYGRYPLLTEPLTYPNSLYYVNPSTYTCGYSTVDTTPVCNQVVTSIAAQATVQSVDVGSSINTTVIATMLDGTTKSVSCSNNYNPNVIGLQTVTFTYNGIAGSAKTTGTRTCTASVTVKVNNLPSSLSVIPSSNTVYNGTEPTYTVTVTYASGTTKVLSSGFTKTGWTSGVGVKTVGFSFTENGKTVTTSVNITVKPNITGITVTPAHQSIERYTNPTFSVRATYENSSTASVLGFSAVGFNKNNIGIQNVTIKYSEGGITKTASTTVTVTAMKRTCPICGTEYYLDANDFDQGCPVCKVTVGFIQVSPEYLTLQLGASLPIVVTATFLDGHTEEVTGWSSNYNPLVTGNQMVMVTYLGKYTFISVNVRASKVCGICGANYALNDDGTDPGCPICKNLLLSISATPNVQTLRQGDALILTVTGLYRDGHSTVISDWSSDYNKSKVGKQQVTVYYSGQSCVVQVTVTSEDDIQCTVCGTVYNLRDNPWGCPVCINTLTGIDAVLKIGGTRVPYGTSLDLRVVLIYQDGHREMVFEGWTDNFDPFTMGVQSVTVSYSDVFTNTVSCALSVEVVDRTNEMVCVNGHVYYPDDSGGGCPYCASLSETGAESMYNCSYTDEILDTLYTNGIYHFEAGDYVTVNVSVKIDGSIFSFKLIGKKEDRAPLSYGCEVA